MKKTKPAEEELPRPDIGRDEPLLIFTRTLTIGTLLQVASKRSRDPHFWRSIGLILIIIKRRKIVHATKIFAMQGKCDIVAWLRLKTSFLVFQVELEVSQGDADAVLGYGGGSHQ